MHEGLKITSLFAALLATVACAPKIRVPDAELAIINVSVIDGHGGPAVARRTVLIADGRIAAVAPAERTEVPVTARVLDGSGRFLVSGTCTFTPGDRAPSRSSS